MVYPSIETVFLFIDSSNFEMTFSRIHDFKTLGNQSFLKFNSEIETPNQINLTNLTISGVSQLCEQSFCLKSNTQPFFSLKNARNIVLSNLYISESKISKFF